jgi:hypothetical protein
MGLGETTEEDLSAEGVEDVEEEEEEEEEEDGDDFFDELYRGLNGT